MAGIDHYAVLDIKPDAAPEDIKKAYRAMAIQTHPDRGGVTHLFRMVQEAYETLSDPEKRAAYDRALAGPAVKPAPAPHQDDDEDSYVYSGPVQPAAPPAPRTRRDKAIRIAKIAVIAAVPGWAVGAWLLNVIGLWQLVQPTTGLHLVVFQGMPALVYIVLWLFSTLVAAVSEEMGPAVSIPIVAAVITSVFAFITAVGNHSDWIPALVTGFVATFVVAVTVRLKDVLTGWIG